MLFRGILLDWKVYSLLLHKLPNILILQIIKSKLAMQSEEVGIQCLLWKNLGHPTSLGQVDT